MRLWRVAPANPFDKIEPLDEEGRPGDVTTPGNVLVPRLLVEEWIALGAERVFWGAGAKVSREGRERALHTLAHIRDVAAIAGIDLDHIRVDDDDEGLVDLTPEDDDGEAGLGWALVTVEQEIRKRVELDARRAAAKPKRRSR